MLTLYREGLRHSKPDPNASGVVILTLHGIVLGKGGGASRGVVAVVVVVLRCSQS